MCYGKIDNFFYFFIGNRRLVCNCIVSPSVFSGLFKRFLHYNSFLYYDIYNKEQPIMKSCSVKENICNFATQMKKING